MVKELPERQRRVLDCIEAYVADRGFPPTVREIGDAIGVNSTSLISYYLKRLEERGLISREPSMSRAIQLTTSGHASDGGRDNEREMISIPFYGPIAAGEPIMAEAVVTPEDTLEISRALFGRDTSGLFALRVEGTSMIDALVADGDTVILKHQDRVENGQMAAVWLLDEGETTLKKFYDEGSRVRLQPANPTMSPIYVPARNVRVQGKVVLVIRQLA